MKIFFKTVLNAFLILVGFLIFWNAINPNRWPEEMIKNLMIKNLPLGSNIEEVEGYIISKGWEITNIDEANGLTEQASKDGNRYFCNEDESKKLSNEMSYYKCSKSFSHEYACKVSGGELRKLCDGCINLCISNDRQVFIDRNQACLRSGGTLILKKIKVNEFCEIGKKYIRASIGSYMTLFPLPLPMVTDVSVEWVFNSDDNLIDVRVQKGIDAP